ncbi:TPA: hypothetical protein ACH3X1_004062 [Trebouxia sp. C0004]
MPARGSPVVLNWLAEAGLSAYAPGFENFSADDFKSLLMQDYGKYGVTDMDSKQRLFRLIKRVSSDDTAYPAPKRSNASPAPDAKGLLGNAGLLDLDTHDSSLLSEDIYSAPAHHGPAVVAGHVLPGLNGHHQPASSSAAAFVEESNPPKIRVVVRKRPLNTKELEKGEDDIIEVAMKDASLIVNELKVKVDLTKFTERHLFSFDDALDESVGNDEVYRSTVQPLVATIFKNGKATCFAYGQTGSGKTFTMQPLPMRAARDMFALLEDPQFADLSLFVSCFEIYGGKLYDLLNGRKRLNMMEDGKKRVCIVDLKEVEVNDEDIIQQLMEHSNANRSTGSTGANSESSRSHSIMQFCLRKLKDGGEPGKQIGKISFIDLAGSERGADTYDNDRQTRLEGAEINKSLLALKECIRALDSVARHVPFRGSKLTEVLRDSFVGEEARTVMIANVSPNALSCEHTLNTLRYADRVKELRKDFVKKAPGPVAEAAAPIRSLAPPPTNMAQANNARGEGKAGVFVANRNISPRPQRPLSPRDQPTAAPSPQARLSPTPAAVPPSSRGNLEPVSPRPARKKGSALSSRDPSPPPKTSWADGHAHPAADRALEQQPSSRCRRSRTPVRRTTSRDSDITQQYLDDGGDAEEQQLEQDRNLLYQQLQDEEDELITAHRKQIEATMAIVREEMNLLAQVDQPGSLIDTYVERLELIIQEKSRGIRDLQKLLDSFKSRLQQEEVFSKSMGKNKLKDFLK